jgi:hypothetical protein
MDILNVTESLFYSDDSVDTMNVSVVVENVTASVVKNVVRHNCTGVDEESMKTYQKVSWSQCPQNLFSSSLTTRQNKLEHLSLASFCRLIQYLRVRLEPN